VEADRQHPQPDVSVDKALAAAEHLRGHLLGDEQGTQTDHDAVDHDEVRGRAR